MLVLLTFSDSDSEEDEPQFYLASESHGRTQHSAHHATHNLSLLSLTVIINKGRIQARTDKKVSEKLEKSTICDFSVFIQLLTHIPLFRRIRVMENLCSTLKRGRYSVWHSTRMTPILIFCVLRANKSSFTIKVLMFFSECFTSCIIHMFNYAKEFLDMNVNY